MRVRPCGSPVVRSAALTALVALACTGCGDPDASTAPEVEVSEARVRALLPGQDKTAGYFTLRNHRQQAVVLTGAHGAGARAIEMHVTTRDGDMTRMRRLDEVEVSPGETVRFEPGGRHLMLFGVDVLDAEPVIVLELEDGSGIPVTFTTIAIGDR